MDTTDNLDNCIAWELFSAFCFYRYELLGESLPIPIYHDRIKTDKFWAYRSMCWACYLPGEVRMADNIEWREVLQATFQIILDAFSQFLSMDVQLMSLRMYFCLQNNGCRSQSCWKNQNVICHITMLSATVQPQPLCYLPQIVLGWDPGLK